MDCNHMYDRSFGSRLTAEEWVEIGAKTPSLFEEPIRDADYDLAAAMPELTRMRHIERRTRLASHEDVSASDQQGSPSKSRRQSRVTQQVTAAFRKARDSITGWIAGEDHHTQVTAGVEVVPYSRPPYLDDVLEPESHRQPMIEEPFATAGLSRFPAQTDAFLANEIAIDVVRHDAEKELDVRLQVAIRNGEFEERILAARFDAIELKDTSEEAQWRASYDFERSSAERHNLVQTTEQDDPSLELEVDSDVDMDHLPFEL